MEGGKTMESRLWQEIDKYLQNLFEDGVSPVLQVTESTNNATVHQLAKDTVSVPTSSPNSEVENETPNREMAATVQEHAGSVGGSRNIDEIKRKYIVGKISGKEIRDQQGRLIIAQNEIITEKVVDQADQHGKLVELIVHMTIKW